LRAKIKLVSVHYLRFSLSAIHSPSHILNLNTPLILCMCVLYVCVTEHLRLFRHTVIVWLLYFMRGALTCVLGKLFYQLFPVSVLRDVAHKESVVIERNGHANALVLAELIVVELRGEKRKKTVGLSWHYRL